jgi:hypothetical protein
MKELTIVATLVWKLLKHVYCHVTEQGDVIFSTDLQIFQQTMSYFHIASLANFSIGSKLGFAGFTVNSQFIVTFYKRY